MLREQLILADQKDTAQNITALADDFLVNMKRLSEHPFQALVVYQKWVGIALEMPHSQQITWVETIRLKKNLSAHRASAVTYLMLDFVLLPITFNEGCEQSQKLQKVLELQRFQFLRSMQIMRANDDRFFLNCVYSILLEKLRIPE